MIRGVFRFRGRSRDRNDDQTRVLLTQRQHELLDTETALLDRLDALLADYPAIAEDRAAIAQAKEHLTALFLLVIVGEFNAGKSAFINALIGEEVMPEGVTPTTAVINVLRFGEISDETMQPDGIIERTYPADFLEDISVVDTPGTNAIIREHEALTQRYVPRADLVLFVTSADRPFTESEREFMAQIREWGKKIVLVVNKIDLLREEKSVDEVISFVRDNIARLLGFTPEIFPVSALLAQQAKALAEKNPDERDRLWAQSRFESLEHYVIDTLDEASRIQLKLLNPLGVAEHISDRYLQSTAERLHVLADDMATIEKIDRELTAYQEDMRRQFTYHLTRIENIIAKMNDRGDTFFEENIRIGRIFDLMKPERIRGEFEQVVVADTEQKIDTTINELIDWMVEEDLRIWQAVTDYLDRRRLSQYEGEMIGQVGGQFRYDRRSLLDAVSKVAREEIERYDARAEAHEMALSVRNAVASVAVTEAGAVGLGAIIVAATSTVAIDITGILAASLIAGIGLVILPIKRRRAREEFRRRTAELERRLVDVMNEQFQHELTRSVGRINDAIAPYTRFVRTEQNKFETVQQNLTDLRNDLRALRHQIGGDEESAAPVTTPALAEQTGSNDRLSLPAGSEKQAANGAATERETANGSVPAPRSSNKR